MIFDYASVIDHGQQDYANKSPDGSMPAKITCYQLN